MKVRILGVRKLRDMVERGNPLSGGAGAAKHGPRPRGRSSSPCVALDMYEPVHGHFGCITMFWSVRRLSSTSSRADPYCLPASKTTSLLR